MPMPLVETMAALPGGKRQAGVDLPSVCRHLVSNYIGKQSEKNRRAKAARRQRFYMSGGDQDMATFVTTVVKDPVVQAKRLEFIEHSKFNNVLRRVTHELASCYAMPAKRTVANEADNARYQALQRDCRQDELMLRANRLAILHRNVVIGPRVRDANGTPEPVLDIVTPDCFWAVSHPLDPTALVALILDVNYNTLDSSRQPEYIVWSAAEWFFLDGHGIPLSTETTPHDHGRIPYLLFSIEPPAGRLLDETTGDDLEAAHRSVWFLNILLLKEAKSATKNHVVQGDVSNSIRNQASDTDVPIQLPEGVQLQTIDNSMDLDMYLAAARGVYETSAANYGLPPSVLSHSDVQSAEARELQRVPLREIRLQQQIPFRALERQLAELQSIVIGKQMSEYRFSTEGWSIDFADPQTPLGTKDALDVFEKERGLGLTSTVKEIMRRNPDLDEEAAGEEMLDNIADELARNRAMKPLQQISGSMGASVVPMQGRTGDDDPDDGGNAPPFMEAA